MSYEETPDTSRACAGLSRGRGPLEKQFADYFANAEEGIIAGTCYNETTSDSRPVEGMVGQKSHRVACKLADGTNPDRVMETGICNLPQDEASALVHFGSEKTETWLMFRLPEPSGEGQGG